MKFMKNFALVLEMEINHPGTIADLTCDVAHTGLLIAILEKHLSCTVQYALAHFLLLFLLSFCNAHG
ncbi:hypothetical protein D3C87_1987870 [compost metagenome]